VHATASQPAQQNTRSLPSTSARRAGAPAGSPQWKQLSMEAMLGRRSIQLLTCVNTAARAAPSLDASQTHKRSPAMLVSANDFRIKAENFDLTNGANLVRIAAGAFMFPHVAGKFAGGALSAATVGFFAKAGFTPPELWVYLAAFAETMTGLCLVLGICTRYAALGAAAVRGVCVAGREGLQRLDLEQGRLRVPGVLGDRLHRHRDRGVESRFRRTPRQGRRAGGQAGRELAPKPQPQLGRLHAQIFQRVPVKRRVGQTTRPRCMFLACFSFWSCFASGSRTSSSAL
jgi:hypothetical protein